MTLPPARYGTISQVFFMSGFLALSARPVLQEFDIHIGTPNRGKTHLINAKYPAINNSGTSHSVTFIL
jgi:hypothetical protein